MRSATIIGLSRVFIVLALAVPDGTAGAAAISVNGSGDPGTVGDGHLTLREAIRLANGSLPPASLSPAEQARVSGGTAGEGNADTITFAFAGTIALVGDGSAEVLPPLDTPNDTIDGEGKIVLSGTGITTAGILFGLRISASGSVVQGLAFEDIPGTGVLIGPDAGGTVAGVQIVGNRFTRSGLDAIRLVVRTLPSAGASVSGGVLGDTLIQGNLIEAAQSNAINVMAAYAAVPGTIATANLAGTTIADNVVRDVVEGIFVRAAFGPGTLQGNTVDGLVISGNTFERLADLPIYVGASNVTADGTSAGNVVRNVTISRNIIRASVPNSPYDGGGMFISGGLLDNCGLSTGAPTSTGDRTELVEIVENQITDRPRYGIFLQGGQSCGGAGGTLTGSTLETVRVTGNTIERTNTGISLVGASSYDTGNDGANSGNVLRDVTISGNTLSGHETAGLELIGGFSGTAKGRGGTTTGHVIDAVTVRENVLTGNATGIAVNGTVAIGSAAESSDHEIRALTITANTIETSGRAAIAFKAVGAAAGTRMRSNRVVAPLVTGNTLVRNASVGVFMTVSTGTDGGSGVSGNAIEAPVISDNVIEDTTPGPPGTLRGTGVSLFGAPGGAIGMARIERNTIQRATYGIQVGQTRGHAVIGNTVADFLKKAFVGKKRQNTVQANVFGPKARRRRAHSPALAVGAR